MGGDDDFLNAFLSGGRGGMGGSNFKVFTTGPGGASFSFSSGGRMPGGMGGMGGRRGGDPLENLFAQMAGGGMGGNGVRHRGG
jgi:hypothetical protein